MNDSLHRTVIAGFLLALCFRSAPAVAESPSAGLRAPSFSRDVLPILAANCFACHGFDPRARQAGLRLDEPAGAVALLDSGHVASQPGDVAASGLVARIESSDAGVVMPPPTNPERVLGLELKGGSWAGVAGAVTKTSGATPPAV